MKKQTHLHQARGEVNLTNFHFWVNYSSNYSPVFGLFEITKTEKQALMFTERKKKMGINGHVEEEKSF